MILEQLTRAQCEALLSVHHGASLACVREGRPYLVPITYAFSGGVIYSFSLEGQKLQLDARQPVCLSLLVVEHGPGATWQSVVVTGLFEEFTKDPYFEGDNDFAWKALSKQADWWNPGSLKPAGHSQLGGYIYYCIRVDQMTGRAARAAAP